MSSETVTAFADAIRAFVKKFKELLEIFKEVFGRWLALVTGGSPAAARLPRVDQSCPRGWPS